MRPKVHCAIISIETNSVSDFCWAIDSNHCSSKKIFILDGFLALLTLIILSGPVSGKKEVPRNDQF
jgi:hypothetical protein